MAGMTARRDPILVTGSHRSGTTWVGHVLTMSANVTSIHEPFNPKLAWSWLRHRPRDWFAFPGDMNASALTEDVTDIMRLRPPLLAMARRGSVRERLGCTRDARLAARGRLHHHRVLLKDPIAVFAAPWLAEHFDTTNVVLIRHPAVFASSLKRLHWEFDFRNFTRQPALMRGPLQHFRSEIEAAARTTLDVLDQAILLWRVINSVTLHYRERHPDWLVMRYEELAEDPVNVFAQVYADVGLTWTDAIAQRLEQETGMRQIVHVADHDKGGVHRYSRAAMWTWYERLSPSEVRRVRDGTRDIAGELYPADTWEPQEH